jgi:hypothetical protein
VKIALITFLIFRSGIMEERPTILELALLWFAFARLANRE